MKETARNSEGVVINQLNTYFAGGKELTLLEELLGYYMSNYSITGKSCLEKEPSFEKKFITTFDGYSLINGYGVEEFRVDPSVIISRYHLITKLREVIVQAIRFG